MNSGLSIAPQKDRHYGRWALGLLTVCSLVVSTWYLYQWYMTGMEPPVPIPIAKADPNVDESDVTSVMLSSYTVPSSTHPRYVSIPTIGVQLARVYPVDLNDQNMLSLPHNINDAGWYNKSATPGNGYGAIALDGHSKGNSKDGAFAKTNQLKIGDKITIVRGDGKKFTYKVAETQTMDIETVAKEGMKLMVESVEPTQEGLNLMANAGKWVPRIQQFDKRIVVRAVATD